MFIQAQEFEDLPSEQQLLDALRKSDQTELDNRETTALKWLDTNYPLETRLKLTLYAVAGRQEESVNEVLQSLRFQKIMCRGVV